MSYPRHIRNFNAFVDGVSYFGRVSEGTLPNVKIQTAAHRGAGMDGPVGVDMGLEGMTADLTFDEWDPVIMGKLGRIERLVFRPAALADDETEATPIIATVSGLITANEIGGLKPGEPSKLKMLVDVRTFRLEIASAVVIDIDLPNGRRVIGGVDQLRSLRNAMGI